MSRARIVVTGSSGQIGSYVVDALARQGMDAIGVDRRPSRWTSVVGDVTTPGVLARACEGAHAIVHCAAHVSVQGSIEDPLLDARDNVQGTLHVLEAARARRALVVHVSSAAIYGTPLEVPIHEDHPLRPLSPYGVSKAAAEEYARVYASLGLADVVIVRPFNVFSERQEASNPYAGVISAFAARVAGGQPLRIYGDGRQTRDFVHASDVGQWLASLASAEVGVPSGTVMNLGTGIETTVESLARTFLAIAGEGSVEHGPPRQGEIARSCADVAIARKFGFRPRADLHAALSGMVSAARSARGP